MKLVGPNHLWGVCATCRMAEKANLMPGQFAVAITILGGVICVETFRWPLSLEGVQADLPPPNLENAEERTAEILASLLDRLALPSGEPIVLLLDPTLSPRVRTAALHAVRADVILEISPEDEDWEETMNVNLGIVNLGIDPGFGNIKIAMDSKNPVVLPAVYTISSVGEEEDDLPLVFSPTATGRPRRGLPPFHRVEVDGITFTVGDIGRRAMATRRLDMARFEGGPDLRALLLAALRRMFRNAEEIRARAVVGLPIAIPRQSEIATAFRRWLTAAPHLGVVDGRRLALILEDVRLVPQPMGAYYAYVIDAETGKINTDRIHQRIGVVDIGHNTLDISVFREGRGEGLHTLGRQLGIWRAGEILVRAGRAGTPEMAETLIREAPDDPSVKAALYQLGTEIATALARAMGDHAALAEVDHWILAGGGMAFPEIRHVVERVLPPGRFSIPKNPVTINATGMALAAQLLWPNKEGNHAE